MDEFRECEWLEPKLSTIDDPKVWMGILWYILDRSSSGTFALLNSSGRLVGRSCLLGIGRSRIKPDYLSAQSLQGTLGLPCDFQKTSKLWHCWFLIRHQNHLSCWCLRAVTLPVSVGAPLFISWAEIGHPPEETLSLLLVFFSVTIHVHWPHTLENKMEKQIQSFMFQFSFFFITTEQIVVPVDNYSYPSLVPSWHHLSHFSFFYFIFHCSQLMSYSVLVKFGSSPLRSVSRHCWFQPSWLKAVALTERSLELHRFISSSLRAVLLAGLMNNGHFTPKVLACVPDAAHGYVPPHWATLW